MKKEVLTTKEILNWLLEKEYSSVRYFTLTKLLKKPENDTEVSESKKNIMTEGIVPKILLKQNEAGNFGEAHRFYLDKYKGTVWQLMVLAELSADVDNKQVKKACEFILQNSQETDNFGFSVNKSGKNAGGRKSEVIPCLTGNMVWSLIKLGFLDDLRVQKAIEWICKYQRCDDGIDKKPSGEPYDRFEMCWGKHSCHMGVAKSLKALSSIPEKKRSKQVKEKINELAEYILIHNIYKKSHDISKVSKPGWLKLGFPLMYNTDILEMLEVLTDLGYKDVRMNDALEILKSKQDKSGKWILENSFNGKMISNIETKGKQSKWITLKALNVLQYF